MFKKVAQMRTDCVFHSHNISQHSTTRGNEHDSALYGVFIADETLHSQINQHSCYQPDGENWQQRTQDLCKGEEMRRGRRKINEKNLELCSKIEWRLYHVLS